MDEKKTDTTRNAEEARRLKQQARWKLRAIAATMLMCGIMMLFLVVDQPTDAELKVLAYAREHRISSAQYPESLVALLERNPDTEEFVLNYPFRGEQAAVDLSALDPKAGVPLLMQWDRRWGYLDYGGDLAGVTGSGPLCLSMAGWYLTGKADFYPDRVIRFASDSGFAIKGGSKQTLISVGGPVLGLDVMELAAVESKVTTYLEAGNLLIAVMDRGGDFEEGQFIVLTGCSNGLMTIHDPNSYVNSGKEWSFEELGGQIEDLWLVQAG